MIRRMTNLFEIANGFGHRQSARREQPRVVDQPFEQRSDCVTLTYDIDMTERIVVVGGGIIGLATAYRLTERFTGAHVTVLEKKRAICRHQSGHTAACCTPAFIQTRFAKSAAGGEPESGR